MPLVSRFQEDEKAHFERLQAAGTAPGLVVRRCGARGKGLFAARCAAAQPPHRMSSLVRCGAEARPARSDFEEGEVVLREQPLAAIQARPSRSGAAARDES
jgi:hypothetical protein